MIDTHAHLNFPQLESQVDKIIKDSKAAGVTGIIVASSSVTESKKAVALAKKHPGFLWAMVGIHPHKTNPDSKTSVSVETQNLASLLESNLGTVVAIGECGLDFSPAPPGEEDRTLEDQKELFIGQIKLALNHNLPLIIHARKAIDEVIEMLHLESDPGSALGQIRDLSLLRGVFHCYSGGKKRIKKILDLPGEWYFGIDGNLTYELGLPQVVAQIPKDKLLLETDAPFLAPAPYRGQTCTPAYLPLIAQKVAEIWQVPVEEAAAQTLENTQSLFTLPQ